MTREIEERLSKANTLREEEKYGESAKRYVECLLECVYLKDFEGLVHALGGMSLVYKIKARETGEKIYKNLTMAYASESYRVAIENNLGERVLAIANRVMGDALLMDGKASEALPYFEKALEVSTADKCEKGSLKAHLGWVKYLIGQKDEGVKTILEALVDIRAGDMNTYATRVWETGAMNSLAEIYAKEGEKDEALKIINESLEVSRIHSLSIRLREAEVIKKKIEDNRTDFGV